MYIRPETCGSPRIGGICGDHWSNNKLENCYSVGNVNIINQASNKSCYRGMAIGMVSDGAIKGNSCYHIYSAEINGVGYGDSSGIISKTEEEMKSQTFLDLLNQDAPGVWKKDTGINNGYPILSWQ